MKRVVFLSLVIVVIIGSCAQRRKSPIEGAWKLISSVQYGFSGSSYHTRDENNKITMWSENHIMYFRQNESRNSNILIDDYAFGTYSLKGDRYTEKITFYPFRGVGILRDEDKMLLEFKNDTLIQTGLIDGDGKILNKNDYYIRKYVRLE